MLGDWLFVMIFLVCFLMIWVVGGRCFLVVFCLSEF